MQFEKSIDEYKELCDYEAQTKFKTHFYNNSKIKKIKCDFFQFSEKHFEQKNVQKWKFFYLIHTVIGFQKIFW